MATVSGALLLAAAASGQTPRPSPSPQLTFPAETELVVVDVVVLDRQGNPVEGLTADDFAVKEDRQRQSIASFEAVALPESGEAPAATVGRLSRLATNEAVAAARPARTFVVVFDNVHMAPDRAQAAHKAIAEFVSTELTDGDLVTLVPTSGGAWWSTRLPAARDDLSAAMARLEGLRPRDTGIDRISDWEAMRLYLHRDKQVGAQVTRRFYEHRLILEPPGVADRAEYDLGGEHPVVRIKSMEVYNAAKTRKQATLGLLERVAESLRGVRGRKTILLVSEGFVYEPSLDNFRQVKRATREANAAIYFLDARGLTGLPATYDAEIAEGNDVRDLNSVLHEAIREAEGADSVAADSGGFSIKNANDLSRALRQVARESRAYYLIGYQPSNKAADGKFRSIEVEVSRPGVKVRARPGYLAPGGKQDRRERDEDSLDPRIRSAMDSPFEKSGIPLRLTSYVLGPVAEGKSNVLLTAEADPRAFSFERRGERSEATLETLMLVASRNTGENLHRERLVELSLPPAVREQVERSWLPIMRDFQLAPGVYQARLLVRDRESGRIGTVRHVFEVPKAEGLRTSTPILTDVVERPAEGSRLPPRPVPVAHRRFAAGGQVFYVFQVFGAATDPATGSPRVAVGYELRSAAGKVLVSQEPRAVTGGEGGAIGQMIALSLRAASPGEHEIALRILDEVAGSVLELREPFEVAAPERLARSR